MAEKIKILAVDDERFNLTLLKSCLKAAEYEIVTCSNAVEALESFKQREFDVLLFDVLMPGIDGFELRKLVREIDPEVPIIFLTSLVDDLNTTMLNQVSWDPYTYYINKSFSKKQLEVKIIQAASVYRSRRELAAHYRKLESELALAGDLQKIILPDWCMLDENRIASMLYLPSSQVSGDIFEMFRLHDASYLVLIGDIAGHGVQAALYMSAVQSFLKVAAASTPADKLEPHLLLNQLNQFFCNELGGGTYMTCLVGIIDFAAQEICYQSAGHPGLIGCSPSRGTAFGLGDRNVGGFPIGWFDNVPYTIEGNIRCSFEADTILLGRTDGLFDVTNRDNESADEAGFMELLAELAGSGPAVTLPFRVRRTLAQMGLDRNPDDVTLVALQKRSPDPTRLELLMPSQISAVSDTAGALAEAAKKWKVSDECSMKLELLLNEFLNNIIIHGLDAKKTSKQRIFIEIKLSEFGDRLDVRFLDRGKYWDFTPELLSSSETLESKNRRYATSGRGLQIIRKITEQTRRDVYCGLNETIFTIKT